MNLTPGKSAMRRNGDVVRIDRIEGDAVHWSHVSTLWWKRRLGLRGFGTTLLSAADFFFKA